MKPELFPESISQVARYSLGLLVGVALGAWGYSTLQTKGIRGFTWMPFVIVGLIAYFGTISRRPSK